MTLYQMWTKQSKRIDQLQVAIVSTVKPVSSLTLRSSHSLMPVTSKSWVAVTATRVGTRERIS